MSRRRWARRTKLLTLPGAWAKLGWTTVHPDQADEAESRELVRSTTDAMGGH